MGEQLPALFLGLAVALSMLAGCERGLARSQVLHYERSQYQ